ncbi:MAG TPA: protein translocase subunit SecF [Blastocatellia bacterium]|nr:protein translocase subunit SecF [Blastocatellia bacterium]
MVELFHNPRINWIKAKKTFIGITILLMLIGAISVQLRGFNAGVDFTGGTLMTVRFTETPNLNRVRDALGRVGIPTDKVTLQPVVSRPNELIIHAPQLEQGTEAERRVDEDKRRIIRGLQSLSPAGDVAAGRVNVNSIDAPGIEAELRQADPFGINKQVFQTAHPYRQIGDQIVAFRDNQNRGFLTDINAIQSLPLTVTNYDQFDQNKVKQVITERFYAGKIDLNLAGTSEIEDALSRTNPLATSANDEAYKNAAKAIADYRKNSNGVINDVSQVPGLSPDLVQKMQPYFTEGSFAVISADVVGAVVGSDLRNRAIYVTLAALAGMLVYIAFRFEWIYGVAAVLAVFHDVMITLGIFSLFQWEINLTVIAALLTLVGYSMNDTIVIFDRIRENLRFRRRDSLAQVANDSINQTLSRTVITSGLTFVSVVAIVLFGGEVLRGFALALTIGIIIGTYSSIAVASPMMLWWNYWHSRKPSKTPPPNARTGERVLAKV